MPPSSASPRTASACSAASCRSRRCCASPSCRWSWPFSQRYIAALGLWRAGISSCSVGSSRRCSWARPTSCSGILFGSMTLFSISRTLAETAIWPWSQEYLPKQFRGRISGSPRCWSCRRRCSVSLAGAALARQPDRASSGSSRFSSSASCWAIVSAFCLLGLARRQAAARLGARVRRDPRHARRRRATAISGSTSIPPARSTSPIP